MKPNPKRPIPNLPYKLENQFTPGTALVEADFQPIRKEDDFVSMYERTMRGRGILFHYTSNEACLSIFEHQTLRATDIRFLSDSLEYRYAVSLLLEELERIEPKPTDQETEMFEMARSHLAGNMQEHQRPAYVFCLTERFDDLSQWRAYTPPSGGVSLAFSSGHLQMHAQAAGFKLERCLYHEDAQRAALRGLIEEVRAGFAADLASDTPNAAGVCATRFRERFDEVAPTFKHPAFAAEVEWRLVGRPNHQVVTPALPRKVRTGRSTLVPFVEINIASEQQVRWPIPAIVCGPTPHPELAVQGAYSARALAPFNLIGSVVRSSIPYRPWV